MNLTENKLYTSTDLQKDIHIQDGVSALIYDEENILENVTFGKGASLKYFGYFETENEFHKHFQINGTENNCEVYALLSSKGENITAKIEGELKSSHSKLNMHIVSFVSDGGIIDLDGIVNITE